MISPAGKMWVICSGLRKKGGKLKIAHWTTRKCWGILGSPSVFMQGEVDKHSLWLLRNEIHVLSGQAGVLLVHLMKGIVTLNTFQIKG